MSDCISFIKSSSPQLTVANPNDQGQTTRINPIPSKGIRWGGKLVYWEKKKDRKKEVIKRHIVRVKVLFSLREVLSSINEIS